jgi:hypothetical protein
VARIDDTQSRLLSEPVFAAMLHPNCSVAAAKAFLLHAQNAGLEWAFEVN